MTEGQLVELGVDEIEVTASTQVRKALDKPTIRRYAEWYRAGALFPPLTIFSPEGSERYILADGFHRLEAAIEAGLDSVACSLHAGDVREALAHALGANEQHGLPRNNKDLRHAIEIACKDPVWGEWSNRQIAALVKCDHKTVGKIRDELHLTPERVKTKQTKKDGTPIERKTSKKVMGNSPSVSASSTVGGIDAGNRKDLLAAFQTIRAMPFDGGEAVERLDLYECGDDVDYALEWLRMALNEIDYARQQATQPAGSDDDDIPW